MSREQAPTLGEIAADGETVGSMARDAVRQGLRVGRLLGRGGYAAVFEVTVEDDPGPLVLKLPWPPRYQIGEIPLTVMGNVGPNRARPASPTGPIAVEAPASFDEAAGLLREAIERQGQTGAGRPLARLVRPLELARCPAALYERLDGASLETRLHGDPAGARAALAPLAQALQALHAGFGMHGDLKPDHVFFDGDRPVLIDPLPSPGWLGSVGYALPFPVDPEAPAEVRREGERMRDLAALLAITVRCWSRTMGWDAGFLSGLLNRGNGRFGRGFDPEAASRRASLACAGLPAPLEALVQPATLGCLAMVMGPLPLRPGWAGEQLAGFAEIAAAVTSGGASSGRIPPTFPPPRGPEGS